MSDFVENIDVKSVLWQQSDMQIAKAAFVHIETVDGNQITTRLDNGVHFSLCFEDDGRITLTGWTAKGGDKPVFEFDIVNSKGFAVEKPLDTAAG